MIGRGLGIACFVVLVVMLATTVPLSAGPLPSFLDGQVRDLETGLGVRACVSVVSSTGVVVGGTESSGNGSFSVMLPHPVDEDGYRVAFYATVDGDCTSTALVSDPFPVWWQDVAQSPFTPTVPPPNAALVEAGATLEVCLGRTSPAKGPCPPPPDEHVTGTVRTTGGATVEEACVVAIVGRDQIFGAISDAGGHYDVRGLPANAPFVMAALPPFDAGRGPCMFDGGPPPYPPGSLQPVWYDDIWIDLENVRGDVDPIDAALAAGATPLTAPSTGIDFCLTAAPGDVVPRPSCGPVVAPLAVQPAFTG